MSRNAVMALVAVLLIGGGVAFLVAGGDDDDPAPSRTEVSTSSEPKTTGEKSEPKDKSEASDEQQIEQVVVEYTEQAEQGETVECDLVVDDVCVQNESSIDVSAIQSQLSDVEVSDVQVDGDEATAQLERGGSFQLRRQDGDWKISGFEPPQREGRTAPDRPERDSSGGVEAPEREAPERESPELPERSKPGPGTGGAEAP